MSISDRPDEISKYAPRWVREGMAKPSDVVSLSSPSPHAIVQDEPPWHDPNLYDGEAESVQALDPEASADAPFADEPIFEPEYFVPEYVDRGPIRHPLKTAGEVSFGLIAIVALVLFLDDRLTTDYGSVPATVAATAPDDAPIVETTAIVPPLTNVAYVVVDTSAPPSVPSPVPQRGDPPPVVEQQAVQIQQAPQVQPVLQVEPALQVQPAQQVQPVQQVEPVQQVTQAQPVAPVQQVQPVRVQRSAEEIDQLIKRAETFFAQGDVATARLFLERAAEADDPHATLLLGTTYDPDVLRRMGAVGIRPNLQQAQLWYTRAAQFGSREASLRLTALAALIR
jgi:hypothetical protein